MLAHALAFGALLGAVLFLFGSLVDRRGFLTHELVFPYMRTQQYAAELASGHYPQAFPDAAFGHGTAFPRFYPPLPYAVSLALSAALGDYMLGGNLAFLLSVLCSALAMYFMAWTVAGDRWLALAAALVYVSAPYRFVDVFVRGALAESWGFVWYPLIVAGSWRCLRGRHEGWFPWFLPLAVAGALLTHTVTLVYFLPLCGALCAMGFYTAGRRGAFGLALGGAIGVGLALFFLLPQQYYVSTVAVSDRALMGATVEDVERQRVMPHQLFESSADRWNGGSDPDGDDDRMSFALGVGTAVALPSLCWAAFALVRRRSEIDRQLAALAALLAAAWVGSVAFMLEPALFLRLLPSQFLYVQFPWRLLGQSAFFSSSAVAAFAACARAPRWLRASIAAAAAVVVLAVPAYQKQADWQNEWTTDTITADSLRRLGQFGFTVQAEYLPRELDVVENAAKEQFTRPIVSGDAVLLDWRKSGLDVDATLAPGARSSGLLVPLLYYDFYEARAGDDRVLATASYKGFLVADVPPGVDRVSIRRRITPVTRVGIGASAIVALAWGWLEYRRRRVRPAVEAQSVESA